MCSFTVSKLYGKNYEATAELKKHRAPDHRGKRLGEKGKTGGINGGKLKPKRLLQTKPQPSTTHPQQPHMLLVQGQRESGLAGRHRGKGGIGYVECWELMTNRQGFLTLQQWPDSIFFFCPPGRPLGHRASPPPRGEPHPGILLHFFQGQLFFRYKVSRV